MEEDPLGGMSITPEGIIKRDELVFSFAFEYKVPILMVLSGGYQLINAPTIAESIINLNEKFRLLEKTKSSDSNKNFIQCQIDTETQNQGELNEYKS